MCWYSAYSTQFILEYRETSNKRHTLVGNISVEHFDVVWASPVDAAPTTSSLTT